MTKPMYDREYVEAAAEALIDAGWVRLEDYASPVRSQELYDQGRLEVLELGAWLGEVDDRVHLVRLKEDAARPRHLSLASAPAQVDPAPDPYEVEGFVESMRGWGASESTVRMRRGFAKRATRLWPEPRNVTTDDLAALLADPAYSPWTRKTYFVTIRALFGWLCETGRIDSDPAAALRAPKTPTKRPRPLTDTDVDRLLDGAEGDMLAWLRLGLYAGLRVHEVAKMRGEDVGPNSIWVVGKGGKTAELPLHPLIAETAARMPQTGFWFPGTVDGHVSPNTVTNRVTQYFRSVGVAEGSMHRCRHTFGTSLLRSGANLRVVQALMRHESLSTTEGYLGIDDSERTSAIRLLL